ncbi:MAG: hypothetical protein AAFO06_07100 [Cyanobacteria bacterium J06597_16]
MHTTPDAKKAEAKRNAPHDSCEKATGLPSGFFMWFVAIAKEGYGLYVEVVAKVIFSKQ